MRQLQDSFTLAVLGILVLLSGNVASYAQSLPAAGPQFGAQTPVAAQPATNQANPQPGLLGNRLPTIGASHVQAGIVGDIRLNNVLGVPTSHCGHVIDLLISNHLRKQMGYGVPGRLDESPLSHLLHGYLPGDLELQAVHLVSDAEAGRGPIYQVGVLNNSRVAVEHFHISAVGVLGQIDVTSPCTTVTIRRLEAGQALTIQLQLPATVMAMATAGQQTVPFDKLIVAVDSFDELVESNELNNVAILVRGGIKALIVETPTPPAAESVPDESETPPTLPSDNSTPAPLEKIDLDTLDWGDKDETQEDSDG